MVAPDPGDVALRLLGPVARVVGRDAGALVLHVAGPDHLEGLGAVELEAARRLDVQPRVGVVDGFGEVHLDPAQRVHHVDEAVEVQLHEVLDRNAVVLLDGVDQLIGPLEERGVDLVGAVRARVGHEQVAGDGEDGERVVGRVEVEDHHHVAVDAVDPLRAQAVGRVLHGQGTARRGADHQDVLRARVLALDRGRGEVVQIDPVDLVVEVPGVAGRRPDQEGDHQPDRAQDVGHRPAPGTARAGGGVRPPAPHPSSGPSPPRRSGGPARAVPVRPGCRRGPVGGASWSTCWPSSWRPWWTGSFSAFGGLMVSGC